MAYYLGVGISMLITVFSPKIIVCVGEFTSLWGEIVPIIHKVVSERSPLAVNTQIIPTNELASPRLCGSIAPVLQKHFVALSVD
jgi:predicted NBD/HSP70 family sugar kinase